MVTRGPVSYTHLDVYKRQERPRVSRRIHESLEGPVNRRSSRGGSGKSIDMRYLGFSGLEWPYFGRSRGVLRLVVSLFALNHQE